MTDDRFTIRLVHPTDSEQVLTARVSPTTTPRYIVGELVSSGILPAPATAGQYKLRVFQTGKQLLDDVPIQETGLTEGVTLAVDHATSGADRRG